MFVGASIDNEYLGMARVRREEARLGPCVMVEGLGSVEE